MDKKGIGIFDKGMTMLESLKGDKPHKVTLAGKQYKIKPFTLGDLMRAPEMLAQMPTSTDKGQLMTYGIANFDKIIEFMFPDEKIDAKNIYPYEAVAFITVILEINKVEQMILDFMQATSRIEKALGMGLKLQPDK